LPAVRVELNPTATFSIWHRLEDVARRAFPANANSPKRCDQNTRLHWQIYSNDSATTAAEYRSLVVAYRNGSAVRLTDIATITDSVEDTRNLGLANGNASVIRDHLAAAGGEHHFHGQPGAGAAAQLEASMARRRENRGGRGPHTVIRASLHECRGVAAGGVALVILVVFLFLRDRERPRSPASRCPSRSSARLG